MARFGSLPEPGRYKAGRLRESIRAMPLTGDYAPSTEGWARKQAERY
jgi:hypothetical protein